MRFCKYFICEHLYTILYEKPNKSVQPDYCRILLNIGYFTNPWLLIAWGVTIGLQVCAVYIPFLQDALHTTVLSWEDWGLILIVALPVFVVVEGLKLIQWQLERRKREAAIL
jgi:magnesium-transporting ATPase (P-type)